MNNRIITKEEYINSYEPELIDVVCAVMQDLTDRYGTEEAEHSVYVAKCELIKQYQNRNSYYSDETRKPVIDDFLEYPEITLKAVFNTYPNWNQKQTAKFLNKAVRQYMKTCLKERKAELIHKRAELQKLNSQVGLIQSKYNTAITQIIKLNDNVPEEKEELEILNIKINSIKQKYDSVLTHINGLKSDIQELTEMLVVIEAWLSRKHNIYTILNSITAEFNKTVGEKECNRVTDTTQVLPTINSLRDLILKSIQRSDIDNLRNEIIDMCPTKTADESFVFNYACSIFNKVSSEYLLNNMAPFVCEIYKAIYDTIIPVINTQKYKKLIKPNIQNNNKIVIRQLIIKLCELHNFKLYTSEEQKQYIEDKVKIDDVINEVIELINKPIKNGNN